MRLEPLISFLDPGRITAAREYYQAGLEAGAPPPSTDLLARELLIAGIMSEEAFYQYQGAVAKDTPEPGGAQEGARQPAAPTGSRLGTGEVRGVARAATDLHFSRWDDCQNASENLDQGSPDEESLGTAPARLGLRSTAEGEFLSSDDDNEPELVDTMSPALSGAGEAEPAPSGSSHFSFEGTFQGRSIFLTELGIDVSGNHGDGGAQRAVSEEIHQRAALMGQPTAVAGRVDEDVAAHAAEGTLTDRREETTVVPGARFATTPPWELDGVGGLVSPRLEPHLVSRLNHPNIISSHVAQPEGSTEVSYVQRTLRAESLLSLWAQARECVQQRIKPNSKLERSALLEHFLKVCDAVAYANAHGIVHRDLKLSNIGVGDFGEVYVAGWGRAITMKPGAGGDGETPSSLVRTEGERSRRQTDDLVGTPAYMSPEQARGEVERLDGRSDQYALGVILYELVTLKKGVGGTCLDELLELAVRGRLQEDGGRSAAIPRALRKIIERSTALSPEARYATVSDMAHDLRVALRGRGGRQLERMTSSPVSQISATTRHTALLMVLLAAVVVLATTRGDLAHLFAQVLEMLWPGR